MNKKLFLILSLLFILVGCGKVTTVTTTTNITTTSKPTSTTQVPKEYYNPYNLSMSFTGVKNEMAFHFEYKSGNTVNFVYKKNTDSEYIEVSAENSEYTYNKKTYYFKDLTLRNLEENAVYEYKLVDENNNTLFGPYEFKNGSIYSDKFTFMFLPDPQEGWEYGYSIHGNSTTNAFNYNSDIDFVINAGDITQNAMVKNEYNWFFTYSSKFLTKMPFMATTGNHEHNTKDLDTEMFKTHFNFPKNGPVVNSLDNSEVDLEKTYSFDYMNTHFVFINTDAVCNTDNSCNVELNADRANALESWLRNDLTNNGKKFTVIVMHRGPYAKAYNSVNIRNFFVPIFEEYNIDLVISGHDHIYSRSIMSNQEMVDFSELDLYNYSSSLGVTYLVSNTTSTKFYGGDKNSNIETHVSNLEEVNIIPIIEISENKITVTSYDSTNLTVFESFTINK